MPNLKHPLESPGGSREIRLLGNSYDALKPKFAGIAPQRKDLLLLVVLLLNLGFVPPALALDEVNLHISAGISGNALLYKFTIEKGFYREEGLDVRPIQAGMLPGIQGLVGGSFHFSQILGQGAGAILEACR